MKTSIDHKISLLNFIQSKIEDQIQYDLAIIIADYFYQISNDDSQSHSLSTSNIEREIRPLLHQNDIGIGKYHLRAVINKAIQWVQQNDPNFIQIHLN